MLNKLFLTASLLMISSAAMAEPEDSDFIPKAKGIPYTQSAVPEARDPFQLPREARANKQLANALNRQPINNTMEQLNSIEPAAGR